MRKMVQGLVRLISVFAMLAFCIVELRQTFHLPSALQELMEEDWQKVGIGRMAIREQLAALGRAVEPVRAAIQALADRSAVLHAAVHEEGIQRNMGKAQHGIKRLALLGRAGLLVGDEESTNKYR